MDADARLDALNSEIAALRARIAELERQLGHDFVPPIEWGLTATEARLFGCLLAAELVTREAFMAALYRDLRKDPPEEKIIDVFVCKIRRKLKPFGIEIATRWGQGHALTPEAKALVHELVA